MHPTIIQHRELIKNQLHAHQQEVTRLSMEVEEQKIPYTVHELGNKALTASSLARRRLKPMVDTLCQLEDEHATIRSLNIKLARTREIRTESLVEPDKGKATGVVVERNENLEDITGDVTDKTDMGDSKYIDNGQYGLLPIEDFLERPVEIADGNWSVGSNLSIQVSIWDLLSKHASVRAKLRNFAFFKGNMGIRIAFSGTPFHYGRLLCSYQPHAGKNANIDAHISNLAVDPTYRDVLLNYLSQSRGAATIDARGNKPTELSIPYISPKPMLRLYNNGSSVISAATSFSDFADMGDLFIYSYEPLGSVSSGTATSVSYNIYAWFEDVELSTPTATHIEIATESAPESITGPVQRMSSSAAQVAGVLSSIPMIAPFAKASEIVFNGISSISAIFGWSRPPINREPEFVKNRPFTSHCQTIGSETIERITIDPMQELAIDGLACGEMKDSMVINNITNHDSFFDRFTWADTDALEVPIYKCIVHPQMNTYYSDVGATAMELVQPSALSYCATPFEYWRGTITYTFDFVTTQYHRGKIAIWFEPNHQHNTLIGADVSLNKNYVQILDLAVSSSIEISVEWASHYPWLKTFSPQDIKSAHEFGAILTNLNEYVNGYLFVAPFTTLQSPDSSDIPVHVYVRSTDVKFQQLTDDIPSARALITPESLSENDLHEEKRLAKVLNPTTASMKHITTYNFGEQPISFRSCLKRYCTAALVNHTATADYRRLVLVRKNLPDPVPAYNTTYSVAYKSLYGYRYGFLGLRGGIRYRVFHIGEEGYNETGRAFAMLMSPSSSVTESAVNGVAPDYTTMNGAAVFLPHTNGGVEYELPFYNQNLFLFSFATDLHGTSTAGEMAYTYTRSHEFHADINGTTGKDHTFVFDIASGEDFTLMRFTGAPYYTY